MMIREFLQSRHVAHETLLHSPSPSAAHLAQSVHVSGARVAKAVLVRAGTTYVLAVLPATHRIDLGRLGSALQTTGLAIASEDEVETVFRDCERGAIPPFGSRYGLATIVDASLSGGNEIVIEGNTRHEGIKLRYRDFEAAENPLRARFAEPIAPRQETILASSRRMRSIRPTRCVLHLANDLGVLPIPEEQDAVGPPGGDPGPIVRDRHAEHVIGRSAEGARDAAVRRVPEPDEPIARRPGNPGLALAPATIGRP